MSQIKVDAIEPRTAGGNIAVDTDTLVVDTANNKVGIGTTNPGNKLDVEGTGVVASINSTNNNNVVAIQYQGNSGGHLGTTGTDLLFANGAGTERMRLSTQGWLTTLDNTGITRIGKSNSNQLSLADDGFIYLTGGGIGGTCITCIYEAGAGYGAVFAHGYAPSNSVTMIVSTHGSTSAFATTDTDGYLCVFQASGHYVVFKNRLGSTKNFSIATFGASFI